MKRSQKLSDLPLLKFCVLLSFLVFTSFAANAQRHDPKNRTRNFFAAALQIIRFAYVDTVNEEELTEAAISAMLKELDPHSTYMSKEEVEKSKRTPSGQF